MNLQLHRHWQRQKQRQFLRDLKGLLKILKRNLDILQPQGIINRLNDAPGNGRRSTRAPALQSPTTSHNLQCHIISREAGASAGFQVEAERGGRRAEVQENIAITIAIGPSTLNTKETTNPQSLPWRAMLHSQLFTGAIDGER
ncbi:hypothetical protein KC19_2G193400, partial [Ceratodon purpureus]